MKAAPRLLPLCLFNLAYLLAAALGSWWQGNREFIFYIAVMVILIGIIACVHASVRLSRGLLWALSLWGLLHMAGGLVPVPTEWPHEGAQAVLYSAWLVPQRLKYDQVVHAYGFGVTTWLCWQCLSALVKRRFSRELKPTTGPLILCVAAGMGFGALNEVVEFIAVLTIPNTNVGGYTNTGWDLIANLVGASTAGLLLRFLK
jgi:hypothetical protein